MASTIQDYNYDIFISYRQKDNKGDSKEAYTLAEKMSRASAAFAPQVIPA